MKIITVQPFDDRVAVFVGPADFALANRYGVDADSETVGFCDQLNKEIRGAVWCIGLPKKRQPLITAHEALHLTDYLLEFHGVERGELSEIACYLQGHIITLLDKAAYRRKP